MNSLVLISGLIGAPLVGAVLTAVVLNFSQELRGVILILLGFWCVGCFGKLLYWIVV